MKQETEPATLIKCDLYLVGEGGTAVPFRGKGMIYKNGWVEFQSEQDPVIVVSSFYPQHAIAYIRFLRND